ncbi:MAG TPA: porphobilinogen synthase, partial [Thermoanaerobaculia bacterium]|nr:porphobilinogen synthase [Thermoanaerobaculia bacterium]
MAGFPQLRLRRFRRTPALRGLVRETRLSAEQLVAPLFVRRGQGLREPIASLPGVARLSPDEAVVEARTLHGLGIPAVLLFGIPERKDETGS